MSLYAGYAGEQRGSSDGPDYCRCWENRCPAVLCPALRTDDLQTHPLVTRQFDSCGPDVVCSGVRSVLHREPLHEPCPTRPPGATEVVELIRRFAQGHRPIVGTKGLALDNHAVIEQDMQGIQERQFRTTARPSPSGEGTADLTLQWPWVALDGDLVEEPFNFPIHRAKTGW